MNDFVCLYDSSFPKKSYASDKKITEKAEKMVYDR